MMVPWRARLPRDVDWPKVTKVAGILPPPAPNHDGDTVRFDVDRYDDDSSMWDVRLLATFLPELKEPGGLECRAFTTAWLREVDNKSRWPYWVDSMPANQSGASKLDRTFDRYVCLVSNADRTRILNHDVAAYAAANGYGRGSGG